MKRFRRPAQFPGQPIYLKQWRKHCKVTLLQIQQKSGMTKSSLSRIERQLNPYYGDILEVYSAILGVEISRFFAPPDKARQEFDALFATLTERQRRQALRMLQATFAPQEEDESEDNPAPRSRRVRAAAI